MIERLLAEGGLWKKIFFRGDGGATYSDGVDFMFMGLWWLSVACFVGLMGAMVYFVIKYRRRPGRPAMRSASHNNVLEITWTVIPTIIVVIIFVMGFRAYARQVVAPSGTLNLDLSAYKWGWDITYPSGAGATENTVPNQLGALPVPIYIIPEDTPIKLTMSSQDVIHSFWVPDFRFKQDVFPNRFTTYWFQSEKLKETDRDNPDLAYPNREHWVFCAEYCGDNHSEMAAILRVVPREQFAEWLKEPFDGGMSLVDVGRKLHTTKGCVQCHSVDGSAGTGPTWKNMYGYESAYVNAPSWTLDDNAIREGIYDPGAKVRQGFQNQMASYQGRLNDKELRAIIAYMRSLSDRAGEFDPAATWGSISSAAGVDGKAEIARADGERTREIGN